MGIPKSSRIGQVLHSPSIAIPEVFRVKQPNLKYRKSTPKTKTSLSAPEVKSTKRQSTSTPQRKKKR